MPDPVLVLESAAAAAALAALALLLMRWSRRQPRPGWVTAGGAIGVAAGFIAGAWLLGLTAGYALSGSA